MDLKIYKNGTIVSGGTQICGKALLVKDDRIEEILDGDALSRWEASASESGIHAETVDLDGKYIAPGFIELHCHGGGVHEFIDGTAEAIEGACRMHFDHGTRIIYPTISATDYITLWRSLAALEEYVSTAKNCGMIIPGAHLEGPYFVPEACGAQDTSVLHAPLREEYERLADRFGKLIARWSYAPELDPDGTFADFLKARGIKGSVGHSAAEYEDVLTAFDHGTECVTHLYSCTSTITRHGGYRHLGIIETAYLLDDMYVEAIADGSHLPGPLMKMIIKIKGTDRVCMVTDAVRFAGLDSTDGLESNGSVPYIIEDGVAKLCDRSAFAGSIATSEMILKNMTAAGIPLEDVVKMRTQTPAEYMGLTEYGTIEKGKKAVFTIFDKDYKNCQEVNL